MGNDSQKKPFSCAEGCEPCLPVDDVVRIYREELPSVVDSIVESCREMEGVLTHLDTSHLPSKEEVTSLIDLMLEIVFPGYFGDDEVDRGRLPYYVGSRATKIMDGLSNQISRSIRHECRRNRNLCSQCMETGHKHAISFLRALPEVRKLVAGDVRAAYRGDPAAKSFDEVIFCYPGLYAIAVHRLANELWKLGVPVIPRIMSEFAHGRTGIDIHPGATIGVEFFIDHGSGVVIGETTLIGDRVTLYQGVTLGALSFQRDEEGMLVRGTKRHPTIEDDVVIYAGATILGGGTTIGRQSVIGGNVWITRSVPPGTKVTIASPDLLYRQNVEVVEQG